MLSYLKQNDSFLLGAAKGEEATGDWRKVHDEEHHNLYIVPSSVQMKQDGKSRALTLYIVEKKVYIMFWLENWQEGDHFEDLGIDVRVILKLLLNKYGGSIIIIITFAAHAFR